MRLPWRRKAKPLPSMDDDVIGPGHPLYEPLIGTMTHGAASWETEEGPEGLKVTNLHFADEEEE